MRTLLFLLALSVPTAPPAVRPAAATAHADALAPADAAPDTALPPAAAPPGTVVEALPTDTLAALGSGAIEAAREIGLEEITVSREARRIGFENRRFRHPLQVLERLEGAFGPIAMVERRMGLATAATVRLPAVPGEGATAGRFRVRFPTDAGFPGAPPGPPAEPMIGRMDLEFDPLFDYELGRIFEPWRARIQLQTLLRMRAWPGAEAKLGIVLPLEDRFDVDSILHPDVRRVRPGVMSLEQFAWIPRTALASLATGYFGDNRWGFSLGLARPFAGGRLLADAQWDVTGFMAFPGGGTQFSAPSRTSGFAGLTWRPGLEVSVRARTARYLYGDEGYELSVTRGFGDFDLGFYTQHTAGVDVHGWRMAIPIPPMTRPSGGWLRVVPVERFPLGYRSAVDPIGLTLAGVPSRENFLRRLDEASLGTKALGAAAQAPGEVATTSGSFAGSSGFVQTPWAGTLPDRRVEVGWNWVPRRWGYDYRGQHDNHVLYASLGFLPRSEMTLRWTVFPGYRTFQELAPESRLTDTDEMASFRLTLLEAAPGRPGLAVGIEDLVGTRRFHSTYAVAGLPVKIQGVQGRASLGYAFVALDATRHVLDGVFGAAEISPWRRLSFQVEHDTEKWNVGLAVKPAFGLQLRASLLDLTTLSVGGGWQFALPY